MRKFILAAVVLLATAACRPPGESATVEPVATPAGDQIAATVTPGDRLDLADLPILPTVSGRSREIYARGVADGRNPQVFSKLGNCMMASEDLLVPFSGGRYDLGSHADLQAVIDNFSAVTVGENGGKPLTSFSNPSLAAGAGFTSAGPLDPIWANPKYCTSGETPLACEYRHSNPSLSLVMFGTNDILYLSAADFERYMRKIVEDSIDANVLPVLITFPAVPDHMAQSESYNQIVARLAVEYDVPLVNLYRALNDNPGYGVDPQHFTRLSYPADGCAACFTDENLKSGITEENLVILSALDTVWKAVKH